MANNVRIGVQTTGVKESAKDVDGLRGAWQKFQADGSKGNLAMGAAAGVAAAGVNLIGHAAYGAGQLVGDFIHDSIAAASNLNETLAKSEVVFGSSAKGVEQWGNTAADAFGLSKQKAIEAAASFGNVFKGLDIGATKSAEMSEKLVELAGDLASFNNIDPTDALEKLRSGLAGEAEPLRSVGVFLTEAQVKAKAMQMGLVGAHGELSEGTKILARYQLILDQTKTAQGDFARTSDGLANSQRKANAELEDLQATLGQKMLPAQLAVTRAQSQLFVGLNLVSDSLSGKITPDMLSYAKNTLGAEAATKLASDALDRMDDDAIRAAMALGLISTAAGQAVIDIRAGAKGTEDSAGKMADDVERSAAQIEYANKHAGQSFQDMARASRDARRDMLGDATKTVNDYYDVLIAKDELLATNTEINALRKIAAGRTLTKEEQANLHRLERTQAELEADLAKHGATQGKEFTATMADLLKRLKMAHGAEKKAIEAEIMQLKLLATAAAIANGKVLTLEQSIISTLAKGGYINASGAATGPGRARGGPVEKGRPYLVNEDTPHSEVFIPDESGYIMPSTASSPSGGVGLNSGGPVFAPTVVIHGLATPNVKQQIVTELGPLLRDWLRQQGYSLTRA